MKMYTNLTFLVSLVTFFISEASVAVGQLLVDNGVGAPQQTRHRDVKQVAIIGAGAAGSSAAYHLHKFANSSGVGINVTVFERSNYVGGRSTTINAYNHSTHPVELGASIFVAINRILTAAAKEFNLSTRNQLSVPDEPQILGIWDGDNFVYTQREGGWAWWDITKMIWKYGLAPIRTQKLMKATVGKFLKLYEAPFFPFRSLSDRAFDLGLTEVTAVTGEQYLAQNNVKGAFTTDIIQASTRVNYGQNLDLIHGLETMVCMAIEGAIQIEGGNWRIFDQMLVASGAKVNLNTAVLNIRKESGKYVLRTTSAGNEDSIASSDKIFDSVVLAAPLQFSGIKVEEGTLKHTPDEIPYVKLHVTLFTSPLKLNASHFGKKVGEEMPNTILTTLSPNDDSKNNITYARRPSFFSVSTLRTVTHPRTKAKEYLYKIFSPEAMTSSTLRELFCFHNLPASIFDLDTSTNNDITWYHPFVWNSYPIELPRITFEELELAVGFYYTSSIESFISTMETSALMGMNVAQLIVDDYLEVLGTKPMEEDKGFKTQISKKEHEPRAPEL